MEQAIDHSMDGTDPDAPATRPRHVFGGDWRWARDAAQDMKELQGMDEAEVWHYCGHY